ncbi:MAG: HIT domain-containing protein [Actinobacteria bacterium]|nr:HIT domain-containing protein [Actinomycetota bacterium]
MTDCLFCRIVAGEIPADVVARTDRALAFRDIQPQAPVHVLVIPADHHADVPAVSGADPALAAEMLALAARVAREEGVAETGHRLVANTGLEGGQSVSHAHIHVLGGRPLGWPPG